MIEGSYLFVLHFIWIKTVSQDLVFIPEPWKLNRSRLCCILKTFLWQACFLLYSWSHEFLIFLALKNVGRYTAIGVRVSRLWILNAYFIECQVLYYTRKNVEKLYFRMYNITICVIGNIIRCLCMIRLLVIYIGTYKVSKIYHLKIELYDHDVIV